MALIGALPLMMHDQPRRVANIGFGSGITGDLISAIPASSAWTRSRSSRRWCRWPGTSAP